MLVASRVGYTRRWTITISCAMEGQKPFRGNEHEPNRTHFDGCRLSTKSWLLCSFFEHGARSHWAAGDSVPGAGFGGTLFRASGAVARFAHRAVPRSIWFDVAVWLAAGADVLGTGAVPSTAIRGSVRPAIHLGFLSRGARRPRGSASAT